MSKIATASINSFGTTSPKVDFVPISEEATFILSASQLKETISQAVENAIQPLQDRISSFEDRTASLEKENAALCFKLASLESTQDTQADNQLIQLRLINDLREATKKDAQPLQRDRGEILRVLIAANGGKMLAKDARQKMHLSRSGFSQLIATMKNDIELKPFHLKKNQKVIILKSCLAKQ